MTRASWSRRAAAATFWDRDNPGTCRVTTYYKDEPPSTTTRPLLEEGADVFIRFNAGLSILKKVVAVETGSGKSLELPEAKKFMKLVSSIGAFGLDSTFRGKETKSENDPSMSTRNAHGRQLEMPIVQ